MFRTIMFLCSEINDIAKKTNHYTEVQNGKEQELVERIADSTRPFDIYYYCYDRRKLKINTSVVKIPKTLDEEIAMTHDEYVVYLMHKYGRPKCDYFDEQRTLSKNSEIERLDEGLFLHHLAEECRITLGELVNDKFAKTKPFEIYQAENFIYCNYLEHLLLHIKILLDDFNEPAGYGIDDVGARIIWRELNQFFTTGKAYIKNKAAADLIKDRYDDYIAIMHKLYQMIEHGEPLSMYCKKEDLAQNTLGVVIKQIYDDICNS